jgi:hypothetical protein
MCAVRGDIIGAIFDMGTGNLILSSRKAKPEWSTAASDSEIFVSCPSSEYLRQKAA